MLYMKCATLYIRYSKLHGVMLILLSIIKSSLGIFRLLLLQWMISDVSAWMNKESVDVSRLIVSISAFAGSYLLDNIFEYVNSRLGVKCEQLLTINLHKALYAKLKHIEYFHFEKKEMYNSISKMGDDVAIQLKEAFLSWLAAINMFISVLGISVIFVQVSLLMASSLLVVIAFSIFFSVKGMNLLNQIRYQQSADERLLNYYMDLLTEKNSLLELIVFHARSFILNKRIDKETSVIQKLFKKSIQAGLIYNISTIITVLWFVFSLIYCTQQLINGNIDIALFVVIVQSSFSLLNNMEELSYQVAESIQKVEIVRHYEDFMRLSEIDRYESSERPSSIIRFEQVTFRYPGTEYDVLSNVNFNLEVKKNYAIVGENGAGKSTIVKLILGLFQAQSGRVHADIEDIGVVFQDYMKYEMSIRENVAIGNLLLLDQTETIIDLLKESNISEIALQNDGIEKKLGRLYPDSLDLSGGQWQKIAISRGLASSKKFIILDEPTASMDPITESQMYESFLRSNKNRGSLIISHRLASARLADHIFVIKNCTIYEQGSHEELMNVGGYYYELYQKQAAWYQ